MTGLGGWGWGWGGSGGLASWLPANIANLACWLAADKITGLSDGDVVTTWADLSGNSNNLAQVVVANKPTYQTNEQNSLPIVRFDVTDFLAKTFAAPLTQPLTIAGVVKTGSDITNNVQIDGGIAVGARCVSYVEAAAFRIYGGGAITDTAVAVAAATWYYFIAIFNEAASSLEISGNTPTEGNAGAFDHNGIVLGQDYNQNGSFPWDGDIGEYLIVDASMSAEDQALLKTYITGKWGL